MDAQRLTRVKNLCASQTDRQQLLDYQQILLAAADPQRRDAMIQASEGHIEAAEPSRVSTIMVRALAPHREVEQRGDTNSLSPAAQIQQPEYHLKIAYKSATYGAVRVYRVLTDAASRRGAAPSAEENNSGSQSAVPYKGAYGA